MPSAATVAEPAGAQRRVGGTGRRAGMAAAAILIVLVVLDTLSPPGPPLNAVIGAIAYGTKTLIGVGVVVLGMWALATARLPLLFRAAMVAYVLVVLGWFIAWLLVDAGSDAVTYLLNPTYSVWSWLLILMVPIVARFNREGAITDTVARIPLLVAVLLLVVPTVGSGLLGLTLNNSNAGVAMLLLLACRTGGVQTRGIRALLALGVGAAMLVTGYRIYALGSLVFILNQLPPRMTRRLLIVQVLLLSFTPLIFQFVITNYGDILVSQANQNFFDTRSFLFEELINDFSFSEIWTGRGLRGSYYSPYFFNIAKNYGQAVGYTNIWRTSSEIGWLNVVLHMGLIGFIPFYLALVAPVFVRAREPLIPNDGLRRFVPVMMLLFAGELWNVISAAYFSWYLVLGALLSAAVPSRKTESARSATTSRRVRTTAPL